ncbi:hypothetical protein RRG08_001768 [Elysia crispata]|uniref:Tetraspanin n=1 Tax=Elysia crispata TaxID=231223 RepID=A0AAE1AKG2_9GAST|nr:hypothetical protein RRG08_001768 [Elysia crispata]
MVKLWNGYRAFIGSAMLLFFVLGCIFLDLSLRLMDQIADAIEQRKHGLKMKWNEEIVLSRNITATSVSSGASLNQTLKWPPIPFETAKGGVERYHWPADLNILFIIIGVLVIVFSFMGLFSACIYTPFPIILFTFAMTNFVMIQFILFGIHISTESSHFMDVKHRLQRALHEDYEFGAEASNPFTYAFNSVMLAWNCCGVAGPADFLRFDNKFYSWSYIAAVNARRAAGAGVKLNRRLTFPLACCKREIRREGFQALLACAASGDTKLIYNAGCHPIIFDYLFRVHGDTVVSIFQYVIAFEVLLIIMVTVLSYIPKDYEVEAVRLAVDYAQTIEIQITMEQASSDIRAMPEAFEKVNKKAVEPENAVDESETLLNRRHVFVPYAKLSAETSASSNVTASFGMTKSKIHTTEIW